jgi:rare lipoprotein A
VAPACASRQVAPRTAPAPAPAPATAASPPATAAPDAGRGEASARPDPGEPQRESAQGERVAVGLASYYGRAFEGKLTASGTIFDKDELVAAHPSYPFGTRIRVTNLENGRVVVVRVVDRGPTQENVDEGVIIDLSQRAAAVLGFITDGRQRVRLEILEWGESG